MTLTVSVASTIAMIEQSRPFLVAMIAPLGLLGLVPMIGRKRQRLRMYLVLAAMLTMGAAIAGCGNSGGGSSSNGATTTPPAGTQSFVVTAAGSSSSGNVSHRTRFSTEP